MVMELPKVWLRNEQSLKKIISDDDVLVDAAVAEGRGILYLTPHLGCFEITARYLARRGPITVVFRPPRQAMQIGRASCRERVCQSVSIAAVAVSLQTEKNTKDTKHTHTKP